MRPADGAVAAKGRGRPQVYEEEVDKDDDYD